MFASEMGACLRQRIAFEMPVYGGRRRAPEKSATTKRSLRVYPSLLSVAPRLSSFGIGVNGFAEAPEAPPNLDFEALASARVRAGSLTVTASNSGLVLGSPFSVRVGRSF